MGPISDVLSKSLNTQCCGGGKVLICCRQLRALPNCERCTVPAHCYPMFGQFGVDLGSLVEKCSVSSRQSLGCKTQSLKLTVWPSAVTEEPSDSE